MVKRIYQTTQAFLTGEVSSLITHHSSLISGHALISKTAQTLIFFVILALLPYLVPGFERYRVLLPSNLPSLLSRANGQAPTLLPPSQNLPSQTLSVSTADDRGSGSGKIPDEKIEAKPGEIEDPSGHALDHFFAGLLRTEIEGGRVRVCHYGDSPITNDGITSTVRRRLQLKFGDAGHGFILVDKPWGWYGHVGVTHNAGSGWQSDPMFISRGDHIYGLGGASFTANTAGVTASFGTTKEGEVGHTVSSFDIYFLAHPGGGDFDIEVDGAPYSRVATASEEVRSDFFQAKVEEGPHSLTLKTVGNGEVRVFGVVLETGDRGIEYDSLGVNGAFIGLLAHYMNAEHWAEQLRHRQPNLVILAYGANESEFEKLPMDQYEKDTKEVIRRIRAALPDASIMLVGPMDRGARGAGGGIVTRPMVPRLISYQRRIAAETGCAFFDTFTAMGGEGTVARWYDSRPRLMGGDFTHPTAQGAEIVGSLIYDAIIDAYEKYKTRSQGSGIRGQE